MDSPLLSYIKVRQANLLPPQSTIGEARDLNPWYTTAESLTPIRDASTNLVSQSRRVHIPVEKPEAPAWIAEPATTDLVNSIEAEADQGAETVTKRTMTINRFLPSTHPAAKP